MFIMNTAEERGKEEHDFRNFSSQKHSNLDNYVNFNTGSIPSKKYEISQKPTTVPTDSIHFNDMSDTLGGDKIVQKQGIVQKDVVNFDSELSEWEVSDQNQRLIQINDNVPIAQMLQKEENTLDKLIIKDIWSQNKMVYYNPIFITDTSSKDRRSITVSETQNIPTYDKEQEKSQQKTVTTNSQKISLKSKNSCYGDIDDMAALTDDIAPNSCHDEITTKTSNNSDQNPLGSSVSFEDGNSGNSRAKVSKHGNFNMSLNQKYLHAIETFLNSKSETKQDIPSTAKQRSNVDQKLNDDSKTNITSSDGNNIGHYDNRADKNQNHPVLSTGELNNAKLNVIGCDLSNYDNRSGNNPSDWSADDHMVMYSLSNSKLSSRRKRQKGTTCRSSRRCQMENNMEEYARTNGFIMMDVPYDGNCMFASVVDQLWTCGVLEFTTRSLRSAAVRYLNENPHQEDGTHTKMFLHHETWEEYLYRMDQDAEWGDHIILNTISKILNRCIFVVNISLTNQSETLIHPLGTSLDQSDLKRTLFLGHFEEEHFVSLRPKDWEDTWYIYANKEKMQRSQELEAFPIANRAVDIPTYVKEKTSIDDLSDTPLPHFSFLLKYLLKGSYLLPKQSKARFTKSFRGYTTSGEMAGSCIDGLNFELIDKSPLKESSKLDEVTCCKCHRHCRNGGVTYDLMVHMDNNVKVVQDSAKVEVTMICLIPDTKDVPPGYTKLRVHNPGDWDKKDVDLSDDNIPYLKHIIVEFDSSDPNVNPELISERLKKGIKNPSWPHEAKEWITRERPCNWPSSDLVSKIVNSGCIVVARAHPDCENSHIVWQFLFSEGEHILIKEGLTKEQIRCFSIFKVLFDCHVRNLPRILSTSLLKHIWFYCCEIIPSSYWSENQGACLLFLCDRLLENLRCHNLPNFFIRENNMISQYPREIIQKLGDKVEAVRKFPILSLIFVCERHGILDDTDFEVVLDDVNIYKFSRNLCRTVTKVFVPILVDLDKPHLSCHCDNSFINHLQDAYEMVLSTTSVHRDIVVPNFQDFVLDILRPDTDDFDLLLQRSFIALIIDCHLDTSIMPNLMSSTDTISLKQVIGEENKGMYGELLVPKSKHDCVDFIIKFTTILLEFKFYEPAAFYLRHGIQRTKEEKTIMLNDKAVNQSDYADQLSRYSNQLKTNVNPEDLHKTGSQLKMMKIRICNKSLTILFYMLHSCYTQMNQIELMQEFVEDFEVVAIETNSVASLQLLSQIYTSLGSDERRRAIDQKIISLGGSIPKYKILSATLVA
ncbi:hypothetical protein KUTeg_006391 [Tegillarca granosa]|uniref:OTU domain-containing protein n=1 Tax=Tegillarca granosa TaxID=220873 RepID=A0ABQ9FKB4_TEGGR|nr:hypothetical protein KUTeg_006391 [Tegillarca granosa]